MILQTRERLAGSSSCTINDLATRTPWSLSIQGPEAFQTWGGGKSSPGDLVAQLLAGDDGDLLTHPLVSVEVAAQPGVVFLNDDPGGLLHRLGPDSSLRDNHRSTGSSCRNGPPSRLQLGLRT